MSEDTKEWIKDILSAVVIAVIILQFLMPTVVKEHSMDDTLHENDYLFISKQAYTIFGKPERGDVIVFKSDLDYGSSKKLLVKRIIALPGDSIEIKDGNVYINDELITEDYLKDGTTNGTVARTVLPDGYCFCMGDNRLVSLDSRSERVGLVNIDDIKGKVVIRLFPFNRFGLIK